MEACWFWRTEEGLQNLQTDREEGPSAATTRSMAAGAPRATRRRVARRRGASLPPRPPTHLPALFPRPTPRARAAARASCNAGLRDVLACVRVCACVFVCVCVPVCVRAVCARAWLRVRARARVLRACSIAACLPRSLPCLPPRPAPTAASLAAPRRRARPAAARRPLPAKRTVAVRSLVWHSARLRAGGRAGAEPRGALSRRAHRPDRSSPSRAHPPPPPDPLAARAPRTRRRRPGGAAPSGRTRPRRAREARARAARPQRRARRRARTTCARVSAPSRSPATAPARPARAGGALTPSAFASPSRRSSSRWRRTGLGRTFAADLLRRQLADLNKNPVSSSGGAAPTTAESARARRRRSFGAGEVTSRDSPAAPQSARADAPLPNADRGHLRGLKDDSDLFKGGAHRGPPDTLYEGGFKAELHFRLSSPACHRDVHLGAVAPQRVPG